jgi:segregation and condensation protein A
MLEDRAREWELRFPRIPADEAPRRSAPAEVTIGDVQVWDLVGAMARVLRKREKRKPRQIVQDDTPIEVHIERVESLVAEKGRVAFSELFEDDMPRMRLVGIFLAVLELVRRGRLATRQEQLFDEIWLEPAANRPTPSPPTTA